MRDVLDHVGYRDAGGGERGGLGLALARARRPGVILMDVQLPGMDGVQALARLRSDPETRDIPVVAVTAFAMKRIAGAVLAAGFDGYLAKPLDVRAFPGQVPRLLAGVPGASGWRP